MNAKSWKTTVTGVASGALIFLESWIQNGHSLNWKDPALLIGLAIAILGIKSKDSDVTGGSREA